MWSCYILPSAVFLSPSSSPVSFSESELKDLTILRDNLHQTTIILGTLFVQKIRLEEQEKTLRKQMIDFKRISVGTIITIITVIGTFIYTQGQFTEKAETIVKEQDKVVVRVKTNESDIVNLKIGVAKIETTLDDRFNRLEEILMDLE